MNNTAKNFALQLGALGALYLSLSFLLVLIFGIINTVIPDALDQGYWYYDQNASSIRIGIAMTIVFFPTYLFLTRKVNQIRRNETEGAYLGLTKWLIYLSLLVAGAVLLGDLVFVIMAWLEGEVTMRFIFKALAVLVVIGGAFFYYAKDAQGFWLKNEKKSIWYGVVTAAIVLASVSFGFTQIDDPEKVREMKLDNQQVSDLQDMQWRIEDYYRTEEVLPERLGDVFNIDVPEAPEDREPYVYIVTDKQTYQLCATFEYNSQGSENEFSFISARARNYNWEHEAGQWCYDREVTDENRF